MKHFFPCILTLFLVVGCAQPEPEIVAKQLDSTVLDCVRVGRSDRPPASLYEQNAYDFLGEWTWESLLCLRISHWDSTGEVQPIINIRSSGPGPLKVYKAVLTTQSGSIEVPIPVDGRFKGRAGSDHWEVADLPVSEKVVEKMREMADDSTAHYVMTGGEGSRIHTLVATEREELKQMLAVYDFLKAQGEDNESDSTAAKP